MYVEGSEGPEPVFWFWVQEGASRVALIAFDSLVLTGPLDLEQLEAIQAARLTGQVLDADLGQQPVFVELSRISSLRFVPAMNRTTVIVDDGVTACHIDPGDQNQGLAGAIFEGIARSTAPGVTPTEGSIKTIERTASKGRDPNILAGLAALALTMLALARWAHPDRFVTGPLANLRQGVNGVFVAVGQLPVLLVLLGLCAVELASLVRGGSKTEISELVATLDVDVPEGPVEVRPRDEDVGSEPEPRALVRSVAPERGAHDWRAMAAAATMNSARDDHDDSDAAADEQHAGAST
jgi:hypothetical protein